MLVYEGQKVDFLNSVENDTIAAEIEQNILAKMGRNTGRNEFRSWENSLNFMYRVMQDDDIPMDSGVAIEYNIPQTSKRVDFIVSGYDKSDNPEVVIIELKQWDTMEQVTGKDALVKTYVGGGMRQVVHPAYQAWSYAQVIKDYNASAQDEGMELWPCAYMHNYRREDNDPVDAEQYAPYYDVAPVFTKGQNQDLRDFIKKHIRKGDREKVLYLLEDGKIRPSKSLQDAIASMIAGNPEFVMIDEQKVAYEEIIHLSKKCQDDHQKRTIIVQGGPGTGKSVIAINLLAKLTGMGQVVQYASKNSAPRDVYKKKLKGTIKVSSVDNMFKGSGSYYDLQTDVIDTVLVDEAHRLNEKSGMFQNKGENQIKELIEASRCSVFFIDDAQRVTLKDIGSTVEIERWAKQLNAEITWLRLESQFRCNGSEGYLTWLDDVLEIRKAEHPELIEMDFDFRVMDSPEDLRDLIFERNQEANRSRLLAGYCWEWPKGERSNTNYHDIQIEDFGMSWNLAGGEAFAIGENSVNEIGCIHTSQGLEFDYVGVIIGDDLRYEDGKLVTDYTKRAGTDQSLKGIKTLAKADPDLAAKRAEEIIKNTYRTLMTRGMKGCYVYCVDEPLNEYLKLRLKEIEK